MNGVFSSITKCMNWESNAHYKSIKNCYFSHMYSPQGENEVPIKQLDYKVFFKVKRGVTKGLNQA